jgi:hypothetical protein
MEIADLKKSISEMSDEELFSLFRDIRASRRQSPGKKSVKKADQAAKREKKLDIDIDSLLAGMTPSMRTALLKKIGG